MDWVAALIMLWKGGAVTTIMRTADRIALSVTGGTREETNAVGTSNAIAAIATTY